VPGRADHGPSGPGCPGNGDFQDRFRPVRRARPEQPGDHARVLPVPRPVRSGGTAADGDLLRRVTGPDQCPVTELGRNPEHRGDDLAAEDHADFVEDRSAEQLRPGRFGQGRAQDGLAGSRAGPRPFLRSASAPRGPAPRPVPATGSAGSPVGRAARPAGTRRERQPRPAAEQGDESEDGDDDQRRGTGGAPPCVHAVTVSARTDTKGRFPQAASLERVRSGSR
jgi:hypothetical protein